MFTIMNQDVVFVSYFFEFLSYVYIHFLVARISGPYQESGVRLMQRMSMKNTHFKPTSRGEEESGRSMSTT